MNAQLPIRLAAQRFLVELSVFGAWWLHEVRDAWVAVATGAAPQSSQRFTLDLRGDHAALSRDQSASPDAVLNFPCPRESGLPLLPKAPPEGIPRRARVTALLPCAAVLFHEMRVPPVSDRDVARVVELQLERGAPLPVAQLQVAWRVREKKSDGSRSVEVAMSRRTYIDGLRHTLRTWGWRVLAMNCAADSARPAIDLLPPAAHRLSFAIGARERRWAWSTAALCAIYALVVVGQWSYERFALAEHLAAAHSQRVEIARLKSELEREIEPVRAMRALMTQPTSADALAALSATVTVDSWLFQVDIRAPSDSDAVLSVEGYTPSTAALIAALRQSKHFEQVELLEAAAAEAGSPLSRVRLQAGLRSGAVQ